MRGVLEKIKILVGKAVAALRSAMVKAGEIVRPWFAPLTEIRGIQDLPLPARRAFYALPLFVQWVIGITWDPDAAAVRAARRSMAMTAFFFAAMAALVVLFSSIEYFLPKFYFAIGITLIVAHAVVVIAYVGGSGWIAVREWQGRAVELPVLDRFADRLEKIAGA